MVFYSGRKESALVRLLLVTVLALFLREGACDSTCPDGLTNITSTSGGIVYPSSGDYGINMTKCWKIEVPDTYGGIGLRFWSMDIETCSGCTCDYLQYHTSYNNLKFGQKLCGQYSYNYIYNYLWQVDWSAGLSLGPSGSTMYLRFVSDHAANYKGFNMTFIAQSDSSGSASYLNASEDETISFGTPKVGIEKYDNNYAQQWFLIVPPGRQVQIDFDTFELEDSKDCKNDYVEFREAFISVGDPKTINGQYGPILTKRLCGSSKPSSIQSKGNIVWAQFKTDSNSTTVYKGFKASFKAGQGRLSVSSPLTLLFVSVLITIGSKKSLF